MYSAKICLPEVFKYGNKAKGRISKWRQQEAKHARFSEKRTSLTPDTPTETMPISDHVQPKFFKPTLNFLNLKKDAKNRAISS